MSKAKSFPANWPRMLFNFHMNTLANFVFIFLLGFISEF